MSSNPQQAREALGARLRELRRTTGLNGKEFASKLGWYGASRVSKLELGQQTPSDHDLVQWTTACNTPEALPELRLQLNAVETFYNEWRRQLYPGIHIRQRELLELGEQTKSFRIFECSTFPGLLQTPEYARCRFEFDSSLHRVKPEVDEAIRLRMKMQELLHLTRKSFHIIITETALRQVMAPEEIMLGQLDKVLVATTLRNLRLGVIPFSRRLDVGARHGFWMFDDQLILVEMFTAELRLSQPGEIELYSRIFDQLDEAAVYGDQARRLISQVPHTPMSPATVDTSTSRRSIG
ncbi:MAG TPA: helix-turn-helix transcriptional regulator [Streptosporangiaceae bacterium]